MQFAFHKFVKGFTPLQFDTPILYTNIDQTLVNSLHRLWNCEIGGLDCYVSITEYRTRVQCIHM